MNHVSDPVTSLSWTARVITPYDDDIVDVRDLISGAIPMVILRGFISEWLLAGANHAIEGHKAEIEVKKFANGRLSTIGPWLMKYLNADMDAYYARAGGVERVLGAGGASCLPSLVRGALQRVLGFESLSVPRSADGRSYAPSVIRVHGPGIDNPLHNDKVSRDTFDRPDIAVRNVEYQLSAVVGLQECAPDTGVLRIWAKRWESQDEAHKRPGALGYFDDVVGDAQFFDYSPVRGDMYVFFPEHYHAISRVGDGPERRTLGQFIGLPSLQSRDAMVWA